MRVIDLVFIEYLVTGSFVFRKTASILAFLAVFQLMGGHWIVLQSYAWITMAVNYSQKWGFTEGVEKTFDGNHPCSMCKQVQKEVDKESSSSVKVNIMQLLRQSEIFSEPIVVFRPLIISSVFKYQSIACWYSDRTDAPLIRPPRV